MNSIRMTESTNSPIADQNGASLVPADKKTTVFVALERFRDQLAQFQEGRGVSRVDYGFLTLVAAILTMVMHSVQSILSLLMSLAPVSEISLHVVRFTLERVLDIKNAPDIRTQSKMTLIFLVQLALIMSFVSFVFGSILIPVSKMGISIFGIVKLATSLLFLG